MNQRALDQISKSNARRMKEAARCARKKPFPTFAAANSERARLSRPNSPIGSSYQCASCKLWHITKRETTPFESDLQKTCTQFLEWDGWRALRTSPVSNRARATGFGEVGMADYLYIRYVASDTVMPRYECGAQLLWIEWKRLLPSKRGKTWGRSTRASIQQGAWHTLERERGALTLIAGEDFPCTIEGFRDWYAKSGLQRRAAA